MKNSSLRALVNRLYCSLADESVFSQNSERTNVELCRYKLASFKNVLHPTDIGGACVAAHPTILIVARDRGGGYGEAAAKGLPQAVQVADRWHLMENANRAFLDAVRKSMRQIRSAIGATTINPKLLTAAERIPYEGYLRREEINVAILALSKNGMSIKQIARQTGYSSKLVRQVIRGERNDVFRTRQSSLDLHLPWLDDQWASGCRNGAELWRRLKARGFRARCGS